MAVYEESGVMKYKDDAGNVYVMYPVTKTENVTGLNDILAAKAGTPLVVNISGTISGYTDEVTADKTFADITAAYNAGRQVVVKYGDMIASMTIIDEHVAYFGAFYADAPDTPSLMDEFIVCIDSSNYIEAYNNQAQLFTTSNHIGSYGYSATSSDGVTYTATVKGISTLQVGNSFVMVPNRVSASTVAKLNVNNLGAANLRLRGGGSTTTTVAPTSDNWLTANKPVRVTYDGLWWVCDLTPAIESEVTYGTTDLTAGSSSLATGKLYVVYE